MVVRFMTAMMCVGILTGCASTTRQPTTVNQLQIRVAQMEHRLDSHDQDIADLKYSIEDLAAYAANSTVTVAPVRQAQTATKPTASKASASGDQPILRVSATAKEVQSALQRAGYYKGPIDGNLGSGSQNAIKAFQRDNDLESDGIVGKKTWEALKRY